MKVVLDEWSETVLPGLNPVQVAAILSQTASIIDSHDNPSRSSVCKHLRRIISVIQAVGSRRVATCKRAHRDIPTHFVTNVTNMEEYRRALRLVSSNGVY